MKKIDSNELYGTGFNTSGQLSNQNFVNQNFFQLVRKEVKMVGCGAYHSFFLQSKYFLFLVIPFFHFFIFFVYFF